MQNFWLLAFPLLKDLKKYSKSLFRKDLIAGLTTAFVLIPQSMAYAMLAGLPAHVGLYAAAIPLIPYALLGTSPSLAVGPVAMDSLLTATALAGMAAIGSDDYLTLAILLALMVGSIQFFLGMCRAGFVVNALSQPVIAGFTAASALIIGFNQLKHLLGIQLDQTTAVHTIVLEAVSRWREIHPPTLIIGFFSISALLLLKKHKPSLPRTLILLISGVVIVVSFHLDQKGVTVIGSIPKGLPMPRLPQIQWSVVQALLPSAALIALVGFVEAISVAKSLNKPHHQDLRANQELAALGLSNITSAFYQAFPISGGFSRSAVNSSAGATSQVASLITAATVLLTIAFLTPLVTFVPIVVLGAIIVTAVLSLIDIPRVKRFWHIRRSDFWLYCLTFSVTLYFGVQQGLLAGVFFSLLWFIAATSKPHIAVLGWLEEEGIYRNVERFPNAQKEPGELIIRFDAPLFFANTNYLINQLKILEEQLETPLKTVVLDASGIGRIDATGAEMLLRIAKEHQARNIRFCLTCLRGPVRDVLTKAGLFEVVPKVNIFLELHHWHKSHQPLQKQP